MKVEVKQTNDGSNTLFVPELNEHYHSIHGALQEALHVFIKHGLQPVLENATEPIRMLEVGFGTGLNAILTLQTFLTEKATVFYDSLEKYPLKEELVTELHFENFILNPELFEYFKQLHAAPWNETTRPESYVTLASMRFARTTTPAAAPVTAMAAGEAQPESALRSTRDPTASSSSTAPFSFG